MRSTAVDYFVLLFFLEVFSSDGGAASPRERWVPLEEPVVEEGKKVTLSCFLDGRPAADPHPTSYIWTKDRKVIPGETGVHLTFTSVTRQDAGIYQCENPHYNIEKLVFYLYVSGAPLPQPVIGFSGVAVCGRSFFLECVIMRGYAQNDNTCYTWYMAGTEIKAQSSNVLQFTRVRKTDAGAYTCTAREGPEESTSPPSSAFHLVPLVSPEVRIKTASTDHVIKGILRENLTLTCEVTQAFPEVPDDGYSWSYLPSPKGQPRPLERKTSTLALGPLIREDGGQYICQARNDQHFPSLNLTGNACVTVDIVYLQNITLTSDLEVDEGDPVTLTCSVDSHPAAHLTWTVHGQEVRHVTDNLDHYVILTASCSDSTSYTCRASNTDLPGREISATSKVLVHCKQDDAPPLTSDITATEVSATFDFWLPDKMSVVVVHPRGQDILTVQQDCSLNISSAFLPRCLRPRCDPAQRHLSFTLTRVTEEDEGNYTCREEGKERRMIPDCGKHLHLKKHDPNMTHPDCYKWTWDVIATVFTLVGLTLALGVFLRTRYGGDFLSFWRRKMKFIRKKIQRLRKWFRLAGHRHSHTEDAGQLMETGHSFERLYSNGKIFIFPQLVKPKDMVETDNKGEENESVTLLLSQYLTDEGAQYKVKDLVRFILQQSTKENDPPSFLLHNTRLSRQENIILVLSRKLGVILMTVKAVEDVDKLQSTDEAVTQLLEARKEVRERLGGLVKPGAVTAVLALPNLPSSNAEDVRQRLKILRSHPDVEVLLGQETADFQEWTEQLTSRPDSSVWNLSSPGVDCADTAYTMVASRFLTLTCWSPPGESPGQPAAEEGCLLTPDQLHVRDSTARLLHIWGVPGSGKTKLLIQKTREWLAEGKAVVLAVGREFYDVRLAHVDKAVRSGQDEEACSRIRVCRTYDEMQRAVTELRGPQPHKETCIMTDCIRDTKRYRGLLSFVKSGRVTYIWSTCRDNLSVLDAELWREASQLGWENAFLPDCIRCTKSTVALLNLLMQGSPGYTDIPACSLPRARDFPAWRVVDHCLHPKYTSTTSRCLQCRKEISAALPSLDDGLDWRDWIALFNGNLDFIQLETLSEILENMGIPAFYKSGSYLRSDPIMSNTDSHSGALFTDFARFRELVVAGENEAGKPAVHVLPSNDFTSMEKQGVIVVHWDPRDNDPACQNQGERDARLNEHRRQWFGSAARSKGQVILLLLTPSPARTLLNLPEPAMPQGRNDMGSWQQPARTAEDVGGGPLGRPGHLTGTQRARQQLHKKLSSPV